MNKILVDNNKVSIYGNIKKDNEIIYIYEDGEYEIEYKDSSYVKLELNIDKNIKVKLFKIANNKLDKVNNRYIINSNSNLLLYKFYNINNIDEEIVFDLEGKNAKVDYYFSNICSNNEKYRIVINHNSPNTYSNISNKSIAINGKIDFTIDSYLPKKSHDCVLDQNTKIINLGDNYSTIRPNMYIDLDLVEARHGSVIGRFSDDELFYLMSRGIKYNDCIKLLVNGYIFSNLDVDMDKRKIISDIINKYWR